MDIYLGSNGSQQREQFLLVLCVAAMHHSVFKHARKDVLITSVTLKLTNAPFYQPNTTYGSIQRVLEASSVTEPTIQCVAEAVRQIRARKLPDPKTLGNAGSFFKNPVVNTATCQSLTKLHPQIPQFPRPGSGSMTVPAAYLIQACGWKGWTDGRVGVYYNHALILVHHGGASGKDVLELAQKISDSVWKRFAIRLQPEVNIVHERGISLHANSS
ncbi:UDP-N-acetylenolpyruvoylglucosamine reductase [Aspergillus floccosus]